MFLFIFLILQLLLVGTRHHVSLVRLRTIKRLFAHFTIVLISRLLITSRRTLLRFPASIKESKLSRNMDLTRMSDTILVFMFNVHYYTPPLSLSHLLYADTYTYGFWTGLGGGPNPTPSLRSFCCCCLFSRSCLSCSPVSNTLCSSHGSVCNKK